jgi:hypothetical protein
MNHSSGRFTAVDSPSTGCNGARAHVPVRLRRSSCHVARSGVLWSQSGPLRRCVDATDDREIGARCGFGQAQGGISRRAPSQRRRDKPVITRESPGANRSEMARTGGGFRRIVVQRLARCPRVSRAVTACTLVKQTLCERGWSGWVAHRAAPRRGRISSTQLAECLLPKSERLSAVGSRVAVRANRLKSYAAASGTR